MDSLDLLGLILDFDSTDVELVGLDGVVEGECAVPEDRLRLDQTAL